MTSPTVYIITVSHNRRNSTEAFCQSLERQTYSNFNLILVDDASTDDTVERVNEFPFRKHVCRGDGKLWWAGGVRRGLAYLKAVRPAPDDLVLIANDDTTFDPDFLEKAMAEMRARGPRVVLCASIRFVDTGGWTDGGTVCYWPRLTFKHYGQHVERIDCASTRCIFFWAADLEVAGTFRPGLLRHYLSDYEFTIRARRRGLRLLPSRSVVCYGTEKTTGFHKLPYGTFLDVLAQMHSPSFSGNPRSLFYFVLLAAPGAWKIVGWFWAARTVCAFLLKASIYDRLRK